MVLLALLAACATNLTAENADGKSRLDIQQKALEPANGGLQISVDTLMPGDIILSSASGVTSIGIRALTLSPVSHASVYLGNGELAEAVGSGVRRRSMATFLEEESTVVAFRYPGVGTEHMQKMLRFVESHVGKKYNYMGIVLQAPFTLERRLC